MRARVPAGAVLLAALLLVLVAIRHDRLLSPWVFWPALWLLIAAAVTLSIPSDLRLGSVIAAVLGGTGFVVFLAGCAVIVASAARSDPPAPRGDSVKSLWSADGRYRVEVHGWQSVLGEPGWDVVVFRRGGLGDTKAYAGCLYSEQTVVYERIESVEAGSVRIATDRGIVFVAFDPETMKVTRRIPEDLCGIK